MAKKIAITYEKGGCGKTTTAVNLAAIFAIKYKLKVLLVDLDKQAYATSYYIPEHKQIEKTIYEVMTDRCTPQEAVRHTGYEGLDILPSSRRFREIETHLMMMTRRQEYLLLSSIESLDKDYDIILFDCPPSGERIKENALTASDYIILPVIPDDFAIPGLIQIAEEVTEIKRFTNPKLAVLGVLITMYENTNNKTAYTRAFKQQKLLPVFTTVIRKNTKLSEAINHHKPIIDYDKRCNGAIDYSALAKELMEVIK